MKKCEVCGKVNARVAGKTGIYGIDLCTKHYMQMQNYGRTLDTTSRSNKDPNEIIVSDGYAYVLLYNPKQNEIARAKIDIESIDIVKDYKWRLGSDGYAMSGKESILMHRLIMQCPDDMCVDHIDHDVLHNIKDNLRICTRSDNGANSVMSVNNTSGYKGISWDSRYGVWRAQITVDYVNHYLGSSSDIDEALDMRHNAEVKYQGNFRYQEAFPCTPTEPCGTQEVT